MDLPFITIVSGLPRSGTSMMMQALEAGGLSALTDNIRKPDTDNPKGYYEFEPVKKTKQDPSWLKDASGKVVKMVYRLLYDLPDDYEYRVVFMKRNMAETLASQSIMLDRSGKKGGNVSDEQLAQLFTKQIEDFEHWIKDHPCFSTIYVSYNDVMIDPQTQFERINEFLTGNLDTLAMTNVVDPTLYRNRK